MKIKKLITFALSLLLVFNVSFSVFAEFELADTLFIVSPMNGSVISSNQNFFEASIPSGKNPVNTFFYLDGKFIGDGGLSAAIAADDELSIGKHTLELKAVYDDGTGETAISDFTVALKHYTMDFEQYSPREYDSRTSVNEELDCLYDVNSALFNYGTLEVTTDSQNGRVLRINKTKGSTLYSGNGSFMIPTLGQKSSMAMAKEGRIVLEFDFAFKMAPNWATVLAISPFSRNGHGSSGVNLVHNMGVIPNTSATITDTAWHHGKVVFDFNTSRYNAWVDDVELPEGNITFPDSSLERDFYYYRIGVALSRADDGVSFDNFKVGIDGAMDDFTGIEDVDFVTADGETVTDSEIIPRDVQKLIVKSARALNIDTVTPSNIKLMLGGRNIRISAAVLSENGKEITLSLDNPSGIDGSGESYVSLSEGICFAGEGAIGTKTVYRLDVEPSGFLVKSVKFEKAEGEIFASSMAREGDILKVTAVFGNLTEKTEKLTAVLVVKDGDKYISLSAKDIEVPVTDETAYSVSLSTPELTAMTQPSVYLMFIDSLGNGVYIDSYDLP